MSALQTFTRETGETMTPTEAHKRCEQLAIAETVRRTFWLALALAIQKEAK